MDSRGSGNGLTRNAWMQATPGDPRRPPARPYSRMGGGTWSSLRPCRALRPRLVSFISLLVRPGGSVSERRRRESGQYVARPSPTIAARGTVPSRGCRRCRCGVAHDEVVAAEPGTARPATRVVQVLPAMAACATVGSAAASGCMHVGPRHPAVVHVQVAAATSSRSPGTPTTRLMKTNVGVLGVAERRRPSPRCGRAGG